MRMRARTSAALAAGAAMLLALSACGGGTEAEEPTGSGFEDCVDNPVDCNSGDRKDGGELTWALSAGWTNWNANRAEGNSVYQNQVLAGITPPTGSFLPDGTWEWSKDLLAEEPKLVSDEPQTMSYKLNPKATWNDGTPISIDDFVYHWYAVSGDSKLCDENCNPASTSYGGSVESIEEVDGAINVTFKDGVIDPEWMYGVPISYPAHAAEAEGFDWKNDPKAMGEAAVWFDETTPTWSGGPYLIESAKLGESVTLVPNEKWYGEVKPTLDKIHLVVIASQPDLLKALQNGEIDGAVPASLDPDVVEDAVSSDGILSSVGPAGSWDHIDVNTTNKWLKDVELRKAIFTAIDVTDINERTYGQVSKDVENRTNHIFPNGTKYHEDILSESGQGAGDLEAAKKILEEAGYELADGALTKDGKAVGPLNFRFLEGHTMRETSATLVQGYLKELGIDIEIKPVAPDKLSAVLAEGDFDIIQFGWSSSPTFSGAPNQFWHSESPSNFTKGGNEDIDAEIAKVMSTADIDEAAGYATAAAKLVVDEAISLPLVTTVQLIVVNEDVVNVRDNWAMSLRSFYNMEAWGFRA
ncbi:ABC transporter family substrate-binding protein [Stackebrandtia soli]|uniref:ABC transporter family substrate-binding protein n=1 Tax=Stackebrandtia soli TaxID=1892856 RepID=UPI0039E8B869